MAPRWSTCPVSPGSASPPPHQRAESASVLGPAGASDGARSAARPANGAQARPANAVQARPANGAQVRPANVHLLFTWTHWSGHFGCLASVLVAPVEPDESSQTRRAR